MRFDVPYLKELQAKNLVTIRTDADTGLHVACYTRRVVHGHLWQQYPVLVDCRGTVFDDSGTWIAKPFSKFFNIGDLAGMPLGIPEVTHKLDGTMVTLIPGTNGRFCTKGGFDSPLAGHAEMLWKSRAPTRGRQIPGRAFTKFGKPKDEFTYVFEIIFPGNRIIVDYGDTAALVLLGVVNTQTGREYPYALAQSEAIRIGVPIVKREDAADWYALTAQNTENFEGFCLFWPIAEVRVKVKTEWYVQMHRALVGMSQHQIWEYLASGMSAEEILGNAPVQNGPWISDLIEDLNAKHKEIANAILGLSADIPHAAWLDRPAFASHLQENIPARFHPALYRAFDNGDWMKEAWRLLKPGSSSAKELALLAEQAA